MNLDANQTKFELSLKSWQEKNIQKCIQYIIKENLLLMKDLLKPERIKSTNI